MAAVILLLLFGLVFFFGMMFAYWQYFSRMPDILEVSLLKNETCEEQANGSCMRWRVECWADVRPSYGETARHVSWISCKG